MMTEDYLPRYCRRQVNFLSLILGCETNGGERQAYLYKGWAKSWSGSGSPIVTVIQLAQSILRKNALRGGGANSVVRRSLPQFKMRAVLVVAADVFRKQTFQLALIHRNDVIQQISSAAFNPALCYSHLRSSICAALALAERLCRASDWIHSARVPRSCDRVP
jgi:hypothetical protein